MKTVFQIMSIVLLLVTLTFFACVKEQKTDLLPTPEKTEIMTTETTDLNDATQRGEEPRGCWETCPGDAVDCNCSAWTDCEYKVTISGLNENVRLEFRPYFNLQGGPSCIDLESNGVHENVLLDTEVLVFPEASTKEGVRWRANLFGMQPFDPVGTVNVVIERTGCGCAYYHAFSLSLDGNNPLPAFESFCLQCKLNQIEGN